MTTTNTESKLYTGTVLAGAAKGKNAGLDTLVQHAVAKEELMLGRLRRGTQEALCSKALNMVDEFGGEDGTAGVTCPKCREILARQ